MLPCTAGLNLPHLLPQQPCFARAVEGPCPFSLSLAMGFVAFLLILATGAVQLAGGEELELQECRSFTTQPLPMVHPPVPETSVALVRELMDPFSLQDFADTFWERKPMVIRGRCVCERVRVRLLLVNVLRRDCCYVSLASTCYSFCTILSSTGTHAVYILPATAAVRRYSGNLDNSGMASKSQ